MFNEEEIFDLSEQKVGPAAGPSLAMYLALCEAKNYVSSLELDCLKEDSEWEQMVDFRVEVEKKFGSFSRDEVAAMVKEQRDRCLSMYFAKSNGKIIGAIGYLKLSFQKAFAAKINGLFLRADVNDWKKDWYVRYGFKKLKEF